MLPGSTRDCGGMISTQAKGPRNLAYPSDASVRVLYSFPHKLGADRICYTAWQQVNGLAAAGADVLAFPGVLHRPVPANVKVNPTLAWGKLRVPYKVLGKMRALALHDHIVAQRLEKLAGTIDIVHTWPVAARETLKTAAKLGIPTVLERPNAHTRFAFEAVGREFDRLGIVLPPEDEYSYRDDVLAKEEEEYELAKFILCPSDFVVKTFLDQGVSREKLVRHSYGFDETVYKPANRTSNHKGGLTMLFAGVCAVRKGVHFALEAWLNSTASRDGTFLIAGGFLETYASKLSSMLSHPSVKVLGHRNDVAELMHRSDLLVLPSIEEGFGLVIAEARGSGCVPLASNACTEICQHMKNGLVHQVGDVQALTEHITMLHEDRALLERLRAASISTLHEITWTAAGVRLLQVYRDVIAAS
jgi:glycosyltransferase involved in cell wall biosynthesis